MMLCCLRKPRKVVNRVNLLVIGNADSVWIQRLVKNVYIPMRAKVAIVTESNSVYTDYYRENNIEIFQLQYNSFLRKIPIIRKYYSRYMHWKIIKRLNFECVHINFVNVVNSWLANKIKKERKSKVVATYWGSDLLAVNKRYLQNELDYLKDCDAITVSTEYMMERIKKTVSEPSVYVIYKVKFGMDCLPFLDSEKEPIIKNVKNKVLVAIGYNGAKRQNHLDVIEQIGKMNEMKNEIHLVLQMSYGVPDEMYINSIKSRLEYYNLKYTLIQEQLKDKEVAQLRNQVNIFIHAQDTDAFSASVMEYLYTDTLVLNPRWIKYDELDNRDIKLYEYESFDDIPQKLEELIQIYKKGRVVNNKKKMYEIMSWDVLSGAWIDILKEDR